MTVPSGYHQFADQWQANAQLAWDTIDRKPTTWIPSWLLNVMSWSALDELAGKPPGSYERDPVPVYLAFQHTIGTCLLDQWIPENPKSMTDQGYEGETPKSATGGAAEIVRDGITIDSPEAVVEHLEQVVFPELQRAAGELDAKQDEHQAWLIEKEVTIQRLFGLNLLKSPYDGFNAQPGLAYGLYGYECFFMAYALYPEVMDKYFRLQADLCERRNTLAAQAIIEGALPRLVRLDHDMADSRGMLVDVRSLDKIWFPHFARAITPLLDAGIKLIWHCDGNLMDMVPRLIEVGLSGFQGFQYEDGMDYERICRLKTRDGDRPIIIAGASVTRALPLGTRQDVIDELKWLVKHGPPTGLFLGGSSSIAPRTNPENIKTLVEGLQYYRAHGRKGL
ncbi:hypothetical protein HQ590_04895 [bacterium]|nr:hypothetical protein [bacterium]